MDLSQPHTLPTGPSGQVPASQQLKQEPLGPAEVPPRPGTAPAPPLPAAVEQGLAEASAAYKAGQYVQTMQLCQAVSARAGEWGECFDRLAAQDAWAVACAGMLQGRAPFLTGHCCAALLPMPRLQLFAAGHRRPDLLLLLGAAHYQLGQFQVGGLLWAAGDGDGGCNRAAMVC